VLSPGVLEELLLQASSSSSSSSSSSGSGISFLTSTTSSILPLSVYTKITRMMMRLRLCRVTMTSTTYTPKDPNRIAYGEIKSHGKSIPIYFRKDWTLRTQNGFTDIYRVNTFFSFLGNDLQNLGSTISRWSKWISSSECPRCVLCWSLSSASSNINRRNASLLLHNETLSNLGDILYGGWETSSYPILLVPAAAAAASEHPLMLTV